MRAVRSFTALHSAAVRVVAKSPGYGPSTYNKLVALQRGSSRLFSSKATGGGEGGGIPYHHGVLYLNILTNTKS